MCSNEEIPSDYWTDPDREWDSSVLYDFLLTDQKRCDFDVKYEIPTEYMKYPTRPTIYRNVVDPHHFYGTTHRKNLLEILVDREVVLSNAITHSHGRNSIPFSDYLNYVMAPVSLENALTRDAATTWYAFGENYWPFVFEYPRPDGVFGRDHSQGSLSFGIGQTGSGVPFHTHGPVLCEVFHGRKRWFMAPNDKEPKFDPNTSSFKWYHDIATYGDNILPDGIET